MPTPIVLAILDGWGYTPKQVGNPIQKAEKPEINFIEHNYPLLLLKASGLAVGLRWGEVGNSETGHLNLGAGRVVPQYQSRIEKSINDESFFANPALVDAFAHAREYGSRIHFIGLLTSGTVHAEFAHIPALLDLAVQQQQTQIFLHLFLDGKDSGLKEGADMVAKVQAEITARGVGSIATCVGRTLAMDRDHHWDLTKKAHDLIAHGDGQTVEDIVGTIKGFYGQDIFDLNIPALRPLENYDGVHDNDALIFFNFREDSIRQLYQSFARPTFAEFPRTEFQNLYISSFTEYDPSIERPAAFLPPSIKNSLAETISAQGLRQCHIAETIKYAHVTYFFNGLAHDPYPGEDDEMITSISNIEEVPTMKAMEIAQRVTEKLDAGEHELIIVNFANADMLAHTGNYDATLIGVETVSKAVGMVREAVLAHNGILLITSDHGNAESLIYHGTGEPESRHDDDPVPFYVVGSAYERPRTDEEIKHEIGSVSGILGDVAPTILQLMGVPQPEEMGGKSLLELLT